MLKFKITKVPNRDFYAIGQKKFFLWCYVGSGWKSTEEAMNWISDIFGGTKREITYTEDD